MTSSPGPLQALSLLTPFGGARSLDARAVPWLPWVGALIGAAVGGAWWAAEEAFTPAMAVALVITLDLVLTGMLHLDGTVDSADGLLPHLPRSRRLAVMAEPTIGAFGLGVGVATLLLRGAALASLDARPATIVALWIAGRAVMTVAATVVSPARTDGMGALVSGVRRETSLASAALAATVAAVLLVDAPGGLVPLGGVLAGAAVVVLARRRIGGVTGDVLGAAGFLTETTGLVLASANW